MFLFSSVRSLALSTAAATCSLYFPEEHGVTEEETEEKTTTTEATEYTSFFMLAVHILCSMNSNFLSMICRLSCVHKYSHTNRVDCSIQLPSNSNRYTLTDGLTAAAATVRFFLLLLLAAVIYCWRCKRWMAIDRYYVILLYYDWYCCRRRRLSNQSTQLFVVHSVHRIVFEAK